MDDFLCGGDGRQLRWLKDELTKEFELKYEIMGPSAGEVRTSTFLGRTLRWKEDGIEYEGDSKHTEILLREWNMEESKPVVTPGTAEEKAKEDDEELNTELGKEEAKGYRRATARINYMALDRADLSFVAKDLSKSMAKPTIGDVVRLKRALRYIKGKPRAINVYMWQEKGHELVTMTDSDWAGCTTTRKSTSGGMVLRGRHLIAHWASTQATVAPSSGEAELNAIVKGASETIGILNMMRACGLEIHGCIQTDSSAANGIAHRRGCGKVKHLEARQLWIQDVVMSREIKVKKIPRDENHSDALTHHWLGHEGMKHFPAVGLHRP